MSLPKPKLCATLILDLCSVNEKYLDDFLLNCSVLKDPSTDIAYAPSDYL